ncbi:MAG: tRNA pseudouridine(55) synthase TruB [Acholeplasmatales bacterium]|nr:tRNA pseudouridine(55) synthase TruB [Acholeplasmatales bacterium]
MDGFLIINKDKGITSFGVCNKIKRLTNTKHVGHTGTLDPNTTGVLVVTLGKACKTLPLLIEHTKEYRTTILFGKSSDTLDITGNIVEDKRVDINKEELLKAIDKVSSQKEQIPPMFSAIKVCGKKMYDLARKGERVELKPRDVRVNSYRIESDLYQIDGYYAIDIYLNTSKGFYVRSFARDLGQELGVPSLMYSLDRLSSGQFRIEDSVKLDDPNLEAHLISIEEVFKDLEKLELNDYFSHLAKNGVVLDSRQIKTDKPFLVYHKDSLIAIYAPVDLYKYKPVIIL